jgi:hypothetical protein
MRSEKRQDLYNLSRKKLLRLARAKGIVNAGVLGKIHLIHILKGTSKRETESLIKASRRRYFEGWGRRGGRTHRLSELRNYNEGK